jgi:hypothetical protein
MQKLEVPPPDPIKRREFFRHFRSSFSPQQIQKYQKWFSLMDFDGSGKISCQELTTTLISAGILKNKKEAYLMFRYADVDYSHDICLDEFLFGIISYSRIHHIPLQKLEDIIEETNLLSKETLISQQRRGVLIQYVLNHSIIRDRVVDRSVNSASMLGDRRAKYRKMSSIGTISKSHELLRQKCADAVQQIEFIVKQSATQINKACRINVEKTDAEAIKHEASMGLQPAIESVLSPKLLPLINQPVWKHYSNSDTMDSITDLMDKGDDSSLGGSGHGGGAGSTESMKYHVNLSSVESDDLEEEEEEGKKSPVPRLSFSEGRKRPPPLKPLDPSLVSTITLTPKSVTVSPSFSSSCRHPPKKSLSPLNRQSPSSRFASSSHRVLSDSSFDGPKKRSFNGVAKIKRGNV